MYEIIGIVLALSGALASVCGAWYVSSHVKAERKFGYGLWILGNPMNVVTLLGVIFGLWNGLPLAILVLVQIYFGITAYRGWKKNE
jgi:hypothetical protein